MSRLDEKLAALTAMSPAQLRDEWQRIYKSPAPRITTDLLARGIAWQLQERALGGITPSTARELKRLAAISAANAHAPSTGADSDDDINSVVPSAGAPGRSPGHTSAPALPFINAADLRPGTTLMRSWGDRSWSVLVTETGLVFEGRHYDSLSKIAREITGAHWSGPRFFGLRATSAAPGKNRARPRVCSDAGAHGTAVQPHAEAAAAHA